MLSATGAASTSAASVACASTSTASGAGASASTGFAGAPAGYESLTVAQVKTETKEWSVDELEAALEYEKSHADRKGAIAALESALKADEDEEATE